MQKMVKIEDEHPFCNITVTHSINDYGNVMLPIKTGRKNVTLNCNYNIAQD